MHWIKLLSATLSLLAFYIVELGKSRHAACTNASLIAMLSQLHEMIVNRPLHGLSQLDELLAPIDASAVDIAPATPQAVSSANSLAFLEFLCGLGTFVDVKGHSGFKYSLSHWCVSHACRVQRQGVTQ